MKSKPTLVAVMLAFVLAGTCDAKTLKFPKEKPEFSITFPNDWKAELTSGGIISAQPKGAGYAISIFPVQANNPKDAIDETMKEIEKRFTDVKPGEPSEFRTDSDIKFTECDLTAKDKGDARALAIVAFSIDRQSYYALFQAGTPEADKRYTEAVIEIVKSIAPVKRERSGRN